MLFLAGAGLGDQRAVLAHGVHAAFEAHLFHRLAVQGRRLGHQAADEIVARQIHLQFFMDHGRAFAAQNLHAQAALEVAPPQLNAPAAQVKGGQFVGGIGLGITQSGHQRDGLGAKPGMRAWTRNTRTSNSSGIRRHRDLGR